MFQTNNTGGIHNVTTNEEGVVTNSTVGFHKLNISEERVVVAVQLAYDEYLEFLKGIMEIDLRLGEINRAESNVIEHEGTLLNINFKIVYVPSGDKMDCNTTVLESLAKVFEVKNVACDCCPEKVGSKNTNIIISSDPQ